MNYSICLLDKAGLTQHTQFGPFEDDAAALRQARTEALTSAIVEVWKDNRLITRLYRDANGGTS